MTKFYLLRSTAIRYCKSAYRQLLKFSLIGVLNTFVSYVTFELCLRTLPTTGFTAALAQCIGYSAGILVSFFLNRSWTFSSNNSAKKEFIQFITLQFGILIFSTGAIYLFADILEYPPRLCWALTTIFFIAINFLLMRHWVFSNACA